MQALQYHTFIFMCMYIEARTRNKEQAQKAKKGAKKNKQTKKQQKKLKIKKKNNERTRRINQTEWMNKNRNNKKKERQHQRAYMRPFATAARPPRTGLWMPPARAPHCPSDSAPQDARPHAATSPRFPLVDPVKKCQKVEGTTFKFLSQEI